jgi:hypothetical protein
MQINKKEKQYFINRNNISLNLIISVKTYVLFDIFSFILYTHLLTRLYKFLPDSLYDIDVALTFKKYGV